MFVRCRQHSVHAKLTDAYVALEAAVEETEVAVRGRLQAHSEMVVREAVSQKRRKKSVAELAQERAYAYTAASLRESAALEPLYSAIETLQDTLVLARAVLNDSNPYDTLGEGWLVDCLNLNVTESILLYKRALKALSRFGDNFIELSLGCLVAEKRREGEQWLDKVPELPAREEASPLDKEQALGAVFMARVLTMVEQMKSGGGCISIDREERIAYQVAKRLRAKGWDAFVQSDGGRPALQVNLP